MHPPPGPHRLRHAHGKCIFRDSAVLHPSRVSATVVTRIYPKMLSTVFFSDVRCWMHRSVRPCPVYTWRTRAFGCASRGRLSRAPPVGPRINSVGRAGGGAVQRLHAHYGRPRLPDARRTRARAGHGRRSNMDVSGRHRTATRVISTPNHAWATNLLRYWLVQGLSLATRTSHLHHNLWNTEQVSSFQQEISSIIYYVFSSIKINDIKRLVNKLGRPNKISYSLRTSW